MKSREQNHLQLWLHITCEAREVKLYALMNFQSCVLKKLSYGSLIMVGFCVCVRSLSVCWDCFGR